MPLKVENRIYVATYNGEREIQLCLGDITSLEQNESVDVIMVSAFPGDYIPMRSTLIGALYHNLGLSVKQLATCHKKEDLRKNFSCWISEFLPKRLPYRQLVCFERSAFKGNVDIRQAVNDMFRALQPLFNNQNKSIIAPLLATGCQGVPYVEMLFCMVKTAVMWMKMGLPLQTLKIVIYVQGSIAADVQESIDMFALLKQKTEKEKTYFNEPPVERDVFLIYSPEDQSVVAKLTEALKKERRKIRVSTIADVTTKESSWHHDVFQTMLAAYKIVPLLSASFLNNVQCLELFNIALCCNRFTTSRNVLAPICLERLATTPSYMSIVQWINLRSREQDKLETAAGVLCEQLTQVAESSMAKTVKNGSVYDVFISYSHRNVDLAKQLLDKLQSKEEHLSVFFDYHELKTGVTWQKTLYDAIDRTKIFLTLVSSDYSSSVVCNEEFCVALARYHSKVHDLRLVVVQIGDCDVTGPALAGLPLVDARGDQFSNATDSLNESLTEWLKTGSSDSTLFAENTSIEDVESLAESERRSQFSRLYTINSESGRVELPALQGKQVTPKKHRVVLSYSLRDQGYAELLRSMLVEAGPALQLSNRVEDSTQQLAEASHVVIFMSLHYARSPRQMEELQLILSQLRLHQTRVYILTLGVLPRKPTFLHLMASLTDLTDAFWQDVIPPGQGTQVLGDAWCSRALEQARSVQQQFHTDLALNEVLAIHKCVCDLVAMTSEHADTFYKLVGSPKGVFVNIQLLKYRQLQREISGDTVSPIHLLSPDDREKETSAQQNASQQLITNNPHGQAEINDTGEGDIEKSNQDGQTEKSNEDGQTEKSSNDGQTEKSSKDWQTGESSKDWQTEKSSKDGQTEKSSKYGQTGKPSEGGQTEKSNEGWQTEKSNEGGQTEKSNEGWQTEKSNEGGQSVKSSKDGQTEKPVKGHTVSSNEKKPDSGHNKSADLQKSRGHEKPSSACHIF